VHETLLHQARDIATAVLTAAQERKTVVQPCTYEPPASAPAGGKKDAKAAPPKKDTKAPAKKDAKGAKAAEAVPVAVDAPLAAWHCEVMVRARLQVLFLCEKRTAQF
jgi:hypothetical protein